MDFPNLVLDNKMLTDIIVLGVMLIVIGIAFLIYHRKEEIKDTSKLLHAELILLITIVISLLTLIVIGAIFLTSQWSESSQALLGHLDMPKLVLVFKILVGVASVSLIILIPFLIYYHCYLGKRQRNSAGERGNSGEEADNRPLKPSIPEHFSG